MAFIQIHNTGMNTDAIVRWHDDEEQDTLAVYLRGAATLCVHGEQRTALLAYLTHHSEDLITGDPWLGPRHTWQGIPLAVRRITSTEDSTAAPSVPLEP
jgi:hypothetical protein